MTCNTGGMRDSIEKHVSLCFLLKKLLKVFIFSSTVRSVLEGLMSDEDEARF